MLISCMCLNLIASSNDLEEHHKLLHRERQNASNAYHIEVDETADRKSLKQLMSISPEGPIESINAYNGEPTHPNSNNNNINNNNNHNNNILGTYLKNSFLQKYQSDFIFYSPCMDFYKQAIGPVTDVTINAINQRDLVYSLTLEVPIEKSLETWQLSICINCNYVFCAKKLQGRLNTPPSPLSQQFLFNSSLITNSDEISRRKNDKSFSDTFGILIMDHPEVNKQNGFSSSNTIHNGNHTHSLRTPTLPLATFTIGSLSSTSNLQLSSKQQRLRELHCNLQQYVNREIAETNERIQRYTEQQFALLKSFREKSEQEYELLVRLIQKVPDQNDDMLDRLPPMLEVTMGAVNYSRRRNTISSRRDLNTQTPTTPTTPNTNQPHQPPNFLNLNSFISNNSTAANPSYSSSAMERNHNVNRTNTSNQHLTVPSSVQQTTKNQTAAPTSSTSSSVSVGMGNTITNPSANAVTTTTVVSNILNRKMSNFDTPPATPEATPMSIGNSPTFKQQNPPSIQQPQQSHSNLKQTGGSQQTGNQQRHHQSPTVVHFQQLPIQNIGSRLDNNHHYYQKPDYTDNCVFELEDDDSLSMNNSSSNSIPIISPPIAYPQQNLQFQLQLQRNLQHHYHHHHHNNNDNTMSDLDESDVAEEAEDALDLDSSIPIPMIKTASRSTSNNSSSQMINFAKSLPIEIANSPMAARSYIDDSEEEVLDNTLDIAASIKALAKSVHGEAVFGDLPRPRLRSQI